MGFVSSLFSPMEQRTHPGQPANWFLDLLGGTPGATGTTVTPKTSLQLGAVFACVRVISETVGMLPLLFYERLERGKVRAAGHPLFGILHDLPNPEMTSMELRETLTGHLCLWGNAYCEIEYGGDGFVRALWPLRADKVKVARVNGRLRYVVSVPVGQDVELPTENVMHLRGLGYDGIMGYSPIDMAREAIGLGLATQEFGARFFGNGAALGVVYKHPALLSDKAYSRLEKSLDKRHQGLSNAHRTAILEEGMDVSSVGIPPDNAQFLETREFQAEDIARWYRVQQHKIGLLKHATFTNIEHQGLGS